MCNEVIVIVSEIIWSYFNECNIYWNVFQWSDCTWSSSNEVALSQVIPSEVIESTMKMQVN